MSVSRPSLDFQSGAEVDTLRPGPRDPSPAFASILFPPREAPALATAEPPFFRDLNLDRVLSSLVAGREEYDLAPFFFTPLRDPDAVAYRHEVARDLERPEVLAAVRAFAAGMRAARAHLAQAERLYYPRQKQRWFLAAVAAYCRAVAALAGELGRLDPASRGLSALRHYLHVYIHSEPFRSLAAETEELEAALAEVRYCVHIRGSRVRVSRYEGQADYSAQVEETFAKFKRGEAKDYRLELPQGPEMSHVEARILDLVARLYPDVFAALAEFCARHRDYLDERVAAFDREVQLYLAYLELIEPLRAAGLRFCYPRVTPRPERLYARDAFDLALAGTLVPEGGTVVPNDVDLEEGERVIVVTGPNQGGKTTFARMVGQLHYLASLGLPVPGREARLFLPDGIFTHFERQETVSSLRGKLEDELLRIRAILDQATESSLIVMNESFGATTLQDALFLGREVVGKILALGAVCVCVTFVDELSALSHATVSMVSTVDPANPAVRTYRIVRRPADGLAYAAAIADKYGLTYDALRRRLAR